MNNKKRILSIGEASFVLSGFGTYNFEVLRRLHDTGKYEIAELACYGHVNDQRANKIPWRYYANAVLDGDPRKSEYDSNAENQWGHWRLERTCLDFKPDFAMSIRDPWHDRYIAQSPFRKMFNYIVMPTYDSCFVKGTHVITDHSYKNIEDIQIGDRVLTHDGTYQSVLHTYKLPNSKPIIKICSNSCAIPVFMTEDHPVLVIKQQKQKWGSTWYLHKSYNNLIQNAQYIPAKDIEVGDYVIMPTIKKTIPKTVLNFTTLLTDYPYKFKTTNQHVYINSRSDKLYKQIPLNNDVLQLFGWFIAEGCLDHFNRCTMYFCLNGETEQNHLTFLENTLKTYFNISSTRDICKNNKGENLKLYNSLLNHIFTKLFGSNAYDRHIPDFCMTLPTHQIIPLLKGVFLGDGCDTHTSHNKRTITYCTISKKLALQIFQLLLRLGVLSSVSLTKTKNKPIYQISVLGFNGQKLAEYFNWPGQKYDFCTLTDTSQSWVDENNNAIMRVKLVKTIKEQADIVYNLQVDNNQTFVTSFVVHNCPYQENWIYDYSTADAVLGYTEWGVESLNKDSNNTINTIGIASPGVNLDIFKPVENRKQHRKNMGFMPDIFLVGSVMRNQKRKLFPDLLKAFKIFLQKCHERGRSDLAQKTYLYFHTSYPDRGWNFPDLLKKEGLGHKVVFTYICQSCKSPFCSFFQDARMVCPHCNEVTAVIPSVGLGLSQEQLAAIMQMFDCYVQYAIAGGIEMPAIEAASCGVVPFEVDYAGMSSAVRNLNGIPIKVHHTFLELETGAYRVYPDNDYLAEQLYQFLIKPESVRKKMEYMARQGAEKHYNWDNVAKKWEDYFDNAELTGLQGKWDSSPNIHNIPTSIPSGLSNKEFVRWLLVEVLGNPELLNTYAELDLLRTVNYGIQFDGMNIHPISKEQIFQNMVRKAQYKNECEKGRCGLVPLTQEDYIQYAHERFTI